MSTAPICLSSPVDVLSAVPHLLGFHPSQSLVLVCLSSSHGQSARVGMIARIDLPEEGHADEVADALLPAVAREDPDAAVLIAYGTPEDDGTVAAEVLSAALTEVGVRVRARLVVVEERWQSIDSPGRNVWAEVPGPDAAPSLEFAVVTGSAPVASRSVLEGRCAAGPRADAVGRECARLLLTDSEVTVERGTAVWGRLLRDGTDLAGFSDAAVALAAVSLHAGGTPALRDALAGWLTPGFLTAQEMHPVALAGLREHVPLPWWESPQRQADPATAARLLDRLIQVAGCLPDPYAVPVLTVLAHTAWNQGNGIIARVALDRARAADPAYYLAALLDRMVTEGMQPRAV